MNRFTQMQFVALALIATQWTLGPTDGWVLPSLIQTAQAQATQPDDQPDDEKSQAMANGLLDQGKVVEAIRAANAIRSDTARYAMMRKIAEAQKPPYDRTASTQPTSRAEVDHHAPRDAAGSGGAAMADFDTLMDLIQTTVAPDSWELVGGAGTVAPAPNGVSLDARNTTVRVRLDRDRPLKLPSQATAPAGNTEDFVAHATPGPGRNPRNDTRNGARLQPSTDQLRSVSLPQLEAVLMARFAAGLPPTEQMLRVGGLARIERVAVYPDTGDVVLMGPAADELANEEGLHLSDLVVALHNSLHGSGKMVCSITPGRENLARAQAYLTRTGQTQLKPGKRDQWLEGLRQSLGKQDVTFEDVAPNCRFALTLLAADYHMKLIGMGIQPGGPVESYLETVQLNPDGTPPDMAVLRWWFTFLPMTIETDANKEVFRLPGQLLQVQSENEMLADQGVRQHTGKSEPLNRAFARRFTDNFAVLASVYPVYARLHRSAELMIASGLMRDQRLCERADWQPTFLASNDPYLVPEVNVPMQVDTVANYRELDAKTLLAGISGGVELQTRDLADSVKVPADEPSIAPRHNTAPKHSRHESRQNGSRWWWD